MDGRRELCLHCEFKKIQHRNKKKKKISKTLCFEVGLCLFLDVNAYLFDSSHIVQPRAFKFWHILLCDYLKTELFGFFLFFFYIFLYLGKAIKEKTKQMYDPIFFVT